MDRVIVFPGQIPLDTDILNTQRNTMIALGFLAQSTLGTGVVADGLACTQQTVPNMTFNVGPGSILSLQNVDAADYGSLVADTVDPLVKMGINIAPTVFTVTAPGTTGQSRNYLVQAAFQEADATSVILPYYNASNPAVAYSGPGNSGTPQNTQRLQTVNLSMKTGTAATTGSQLTPTPDAGFVGLWVVTVAFAQTTVVAANIVEYALAPFIRTKLTGFRRRLTANLSLYVAPGGNDLNSGLSLATAFATRGGAWNYIVSGLDLNGFAVTVNVANGTYTESGFFAGSVVGGTLGVAAVTFLGNTTTPASCLMSTTNAACFVATSGAQFSAKGFKLTATGASTGIGFLCNSNGSQISFQNCELGSCANAGALTQNGGSIVMSGPASVSGSSGSAFNVSNGSTINTVNQTLTLSGTPAYSGAFVIASGCGVASMFGMTFTGGATGVRFNVSANAVINTNAAGATYLPGGTTGVSATGGQYI